MRTTLSLDDDVAAFLKEQSQLQRKPFKQVVNDVIRRGMSPIGSEGVRREFKVVPNESGLVEGIDPMKLNQLYDELEVEAFIEKHRS